jgi:hypothetical protein
MFNVVKGTAQKKVLDAHEICREDSDLSCSTEEYSYVNVNIWLASRYTQKCSTKWTVSNDQENGAFIYVIRYISRTLPL